MDQRSLQGTSLRKQVTDKPRPLRLIFSQALISPKYSSFISTTFTPSPNSTSYFYLYKNTSLTSTSGNDLLKKEISSSKSLQWFLRIKSKHVIWHFLATSFKAFPHPKRIQATLIVSQVSKHIQFFPVLRSLHKQRICSPLSRSSPAHTPLPPTARSVCHVSQYCNSLKEISRLCQSLLISTSNLCLQKRKAFHFGHVGFEKPLGYSSSSLVQVRQPFKIEAWTLAHKFDDRETAQRSDSQIRGKSP